MRATTVGVAVTAVAAALTLSAASPAQERRFELSFVIEPGGSYSDYRGFEFEWGFGAALGWALSEAWATEVRWLGRDSDSGHSELDHQTWQLGLRRFFETGSSWRPFVVFGAHLQSAEIERQVVCFDPVRAPCPPARESTDEYGGFVGGGADWRLSRSARLRLEGRLIACDAEVTGDLEQTADLTGGLVFTF